MKKPCFHINAESATTLSAGVIFASALFPTLKEAGAKWMSQGKGRGSLAVFAATTTSQVVYGDSLLLG